MQSATETTENPSQPPRGDRRGGAGGRRGGRGGARGAPEEGRRDDGSGGDHERHRKPRGAPRGTPIRTDGPPHTHSSDVKLTNAILKVGTKAPTVGDDDDADSDTSKSVCFICADPVQYYAIAPCNHVTCHICSLRMRALWKNKGCAHCRTETEYVIFTRQENKRFEDFENSDIVARSDSLGIKYDDQVICGDTTLILRYNCPDENCDKACRGWPDLHRHVRGAHDRILCDLCVRNKKAFPHEHTLFTAQELRQHERHGDDQPGSENQSGFKGHPKCGFCNQRFYSADELYEHCRDKHERCHICDRRSRGSSPQYFANYNTLENHFKKDHFMCADEECLEKKFVVFENDIDLKAHQLKEHPNGLSKSAKRDARRIDMSQFEDARQNQNQNYRGGRRRGSSRGGGYQIEVPVRTEQMMSRSEIAYQRQLALESSQSQPTTTRNFGGQLSEPVFSARPPLNTATPAAQRVATPASWPGAPPPPTPAVAAAFPPLNNSASEQARPVSRLVMTDEICRAKHAAVIERTTQMLRNDQLKMNIFKKKVGDFRTGAISSNEFVDTLWSLFEVTAQALGKLLNELAELYEDESKRTELLKAWNNWKAVNEDYPPIAGASNTDTTSAMTSSASHVLKLKSSTTRSARSSTARQTAWGTAAAPSSPPPSNNFNPKVSNPSPAQTASKNPTPNPNRTGKGSVSATPWVQPSAAPRAVKKDEFPSLPPKKATPGWTPVQKKSSNWDAPRPSQSAWSSANGSASGSRHTTPPPEEPAVETGNGRKKKGKGKQILFHVGL